jgi:hypothetical protein
MKEINRKCNRLPVWTKRAAIDTVQKLNEASYAHYKAFHDSVMDDMNIPQSVKTRHKKIARAAAISAGMKG